MVQATIAEEEVDMVKHVPELCSTASLIVAESKVYMLFQALVAWSATVAFVSITTAEAIDSMSFVTLRFHYLHKFLFLTAIELIDVIPFYFDQVLINCLFGEVCPSITAVNFVGCGYLKTY